MTKSLVERADELKSTLSFKSLKDGQEVTDKLVAERDSFEKSLKNDNGEWKNTTAEQREELSKRNADVYAHRMVLAEIGELEGFKNVQVSNPSAQRLQYPIGAFNGMMENKFKSVGELFTESEGFKNFGRTKNGFVVDLPKEDPRKLLKASAFYDEFKTGDTENTMFAPPNYRTPLIVSSAQRPAVLQDYIPTIQTSERNAVPYMLETTFTNNAAFVLQTVAPTTSSLDWTEQRQNIETLTGTLLVTEEMMQDNIGITGLLNARLGLMVEQTLETNLISGNGTSPQLKGYLNAGGINHQAKGSDDIYTCVAKAITLNRWTGYSEPDYVVMNATDFQTVRTTKDALGNFIWGAPNLAGGEIIWGLPIIITNGISQGTGMTGSFRRMSARYIAQGMTIEVGRINDNFTTRQWTIRATQREGLVINRGSAFTYFDGL